MNENHDHETDEQLTRLLSAGTGRAAPPDRAFLSRLREQSTQAFLESEPTTSPAPPRDTPMLLIRSLIGLSVAAAAMLLGYVALSTRTDPYLFEAVDELAATSSYRVRLVVGNKESEAIGKP
ncbi:MAG: hypothetical protein IAF94_02775, partial [Pirellulaceae bacterium]|nr:hypothetical protein [Pirellulaceae bacterium]